MSEPTPPGGAGQAAAIAVLLQRQSVGREQITTNYVRWLAVALSALRDWYRPAGVRRFAREAAAVSLVAQQAAADQAVQFQRLVLQLLEADPGPSPLYRVPPTGLREADPLEVWERPAETYRWSRSQGFTEAESLEQATSRAETMATTDIALASRSGEQAALEKSEASGYRRVLRPELSRTGTCGLCIVASDRLYFVEELKPIHDNCRCATLPVIGGKDPGLNVNREDLDKLYAAAGSTDGRELKRVRVSVINHGELGPMLVPERSAKTATKAPTERRDVAPKDPAVVIDGLERAAARMEANIAAGDKALGPALARTRERLAALRAT